MYKGKKVGSVEKVPDCDDDSHGVYYIYDENEELIEAIKYKTTFISSLNFFNLVFFSLYCINSSIIYYNTITNYTCFRIYFNYTI